MESFSKISLNNEENLFYLRIQGKITSNNAMIH